jgi:hypothetical protein
MGTLKTHGVDFNQGAVTQTILNKIATHLRTSSDSYHRLDYKPSYYFAVPDGPITNEAGWYIILEGKRPLYVGTADDLNYRLNDDNGSTDNFANQKQHSDSERNFIKKFAELGLLKNLRVALIPVSLFPAPLGPTIDKGTRKDIEKLVNVFRSTFEYR